MSDWKVQAKEHLRSCYPNEGCGVVINEQFYPLPNIAQHPRSSFVMHAEDLALLQDANGPLEAIVHSHPDASPLPSDADKVHAEEYGVEWFIASVSAQEITEFHSFKPNGYVAPLIGRQFSYGTLDCYALVRDYYKQELGIDIPDFDRGNDHWWKDKDSSFDPFTEQFELAGFREVNRRAIQPGDAILLQILSTNGRVNHCGVYLGNNQFLHHLEGKLSRKDVYGGYWMECTQKVVRHQSC